MAGRLGRLAKLVGLGFCGALALLILGEGSFRPKESTRRLWRESQRQGRNRAQALYRFLHGYAYGRWPYSYIGSAIGERRELLWKRVLFAPFLVRALFPMRWVAEYHGKAVPLPSARRLVSVGEKVRMEVPRSAIPFENARQLVLEHPQHIAALDCPCRLSRANPCLPLDVCLIVGEPFASFMVEHHPERARFISPGEAVTILEEEASRGHGHYAFFKEAMLDRFYAICNCCSCCCGAVSATRGHTPMMISSGYVCEVDAALCRHCGTCAGTCPFGAIAGAVAGAVAHGEGVAGETGRQGAPVVDGTLCLGCGACIHTCPSGALWLHLDETKPAPLEIPAAAG